MSNGEWTRTFKHALCELGDALGYYSWTSGMKPNRFGEWVYDLVWFEGDKPGWGTRIRALHLAMESEWLKDDEEIRYDFQKLMIGKARMKLMICEAKPGDADRVRHMLLDVLSSYDSNLSGERYLFAIWDDGAQKFHFHSETMS